MQSPQSVLAGSAFVLALVLQASPAVHAQEPALDEPGLMVREGVWNGGVGTFEFPGALANRHPSTWPADGWTRLVLKDRVFMADPVIAPPSARPDFLKSIALAADSKVEGTFEGANGEPMFVRVPGVRLRTGVITPYRFRNGTPRLTPELDYRYQLRLGEQAFSFRVQNGLRTRDGKPYGSGAQYLIEYDGQTYEYSLDGFGWDSLIAAIADFDGDGKPDFLINVGGSNSGHEYLLLSSVAKPGRNPPTASLHSMGC